MAAVAKLRPGPIRHLRLGRVGGPGGLEPPAGAAGYAPKGGSRPRALRPAPGPRLKPGAERRPGDWRVALSMCRLARRPLPVPEAGARCCSVQLARSLAQLGRPAGAGALAKPL